jgi:hypothetical protein
MLASWFYFNIYIYDNKQLVKNVWVLVKNIIFPSKSLIEKSELIAPLKGYTSKLNKYPVKQSEQDNK